MVLIRTFVYQSMSISPRITPLNLTGGWLVRTNLAATSNVLYYLRAPRVHRNFEASAKSLHPDLPCDLSLDAFCQQMVCNSYCIGNDGQGWIDCTR